MLLCLLLHFSPVVSAAQQAKDDKSFFAAKHDGKWGFIDKAGKVVIPCMYDNVSNFHNGLAAVKQNGKYGLIDRNGREEVPCIYDNVF